MTEDPWDRKLPQIRSLTAVFIRKDNIDPSKGEVITFLDSNQKRRYNKELQKNHCCIVLRVYTE